MFLKILLILAGSIQAFCFIRNSTRIYEKIPGGLEIGKVLKVQVWDPVLYPQFEIRFYPYKKSYGDKVNTDLNVRLSAKNGLVSIFNVKNGVVHKQFRFYLGKLNSSHNLTVQILMEKDYFDIIAFGKQFFHYHPKSVKRVSVFDVECKHVFETFTTVWQRKFFPCPCDLQKTYVPL